MDGHMSEFQGFAQKRKGCEWSGLESGWNCQMGGWMWTELADGGWMVSWYDLPSFLSCLCLSPAPSLSPSNSIQPHLPAFCCLCSNSEVYSCNYAMSVLGLALD